MPQLSIHIENVPNKTSIKEFIAFHASDFYIPDLMPNLILATLSPTQFDTLVVKYPQISVREQYTFHLMS